MSMATDWHVEETDPLAGRPVDKELAKQTVDSRADFKVGHAGLGLGWHTWSDMRGQTCPAYGLSFCKDSA